MSGVVEASDQTSLTNKLEQTTAFDSSGWTVNFPSSKPTAQASIGIDASFGSGNPIVSYVLLGVGVVGLLWWIKRHKKG